MNELITLELEGLPPTVNLLYRNFRGRRYKTASGRKYQERTAALIRREWRGKSAYIEPVELRITFTTNDRRKWDVDNRVKALQDCLSLAGVIEDDRQINILHAERQQGKKTATLIEVKELIQPRKYQEEALRKVLGAWERNKTRQLISLPTGCHAAGTKILMFDGSLKNAEDIQRGDLLMGPDSKPRRVLSLVSGVDDMYRIVPIKGESFTVNSGHILSLKRTNQRNTSQTRKAYPSEIGGQIVNIQLMEYLSKSEYFKCNHKLYRVPVDFDSRPVEIDPYFLGVLLGDGSTANGVISVSKPDEAIVSEYYAQAQHYGLKVRESRKEGTQSVSYFFVPQEGKHAPKHSNPLRNELIRLGLNGVKSGEKFIPENYKVNSRSVRLNILAGLLDTDGSLSCGGFEYSSKSKRLAEDVMFISRSLGLAAYINVKHIAGQDYYRVFISGDCSKIPTRIPRKQAALRSPKKDVLVTGFNVELVGRGAYYGFQVDGDNLYVMGDFTVTHNCGKTIVFGLVAEALRARTLILAHREELLYQAEQKIHLVYPDADTGILKAEERGGLDREICIASIQTAVRRIEQLSERGYKLLICDEAHHAASESYMKVFEALGFMSGDPEKLLLGVTATAFRGDKLELGDTFEEIVFERSIETMMKAGYLCDIRGVSVNTGQDISCVHLQTGDFAVNELAAKIDIPERNALIADTYLKYGEGRRGVIFCVKVAHALNVAESFREKGITCEAVYGEMPSELRRDILSRYANHELQMLANVGVLTEGWDVPDTDIIMMARPTKSKGLYIQCVGRGLRTAPGKKDCLLVDFVDIAKKHELCGLGILSHREMRDSWNGESFLDELKESELREQEVYIPGEMQQPQEEEFDVFSRSNYVWQSRGENYVLSLMNDCTLWCRKAIGGYYALSVTSDGTRGLSDMVLPLDYCMGVCEDYARQLGARYAMKDAFWRTQPATEKQLHALQVMGISYQPWITKGEASDILNRTMNPEATEKQKWYIRTHNLHSSPELLSKREASRIISEYKNRP